MHGNDSRAEPLCGGACYRNTVNVQCQLAHLQEILRANASVKIAADLATKYRKNVQYNLAATQHDDHDAP